VVTAYRLVFGGLLIFFGRVGDLWGRRRLLLVALGTFSLASLSCGLSQAPGWLVGSRAVQGMGAAMLVPSALSLLSGSFPEGPARNRAIGMWGAVAAVGAAAGLLVGGALIQVSWRGCSCATSRSGWPRCWRSGGWSQSSAARPVDAWTWPGR
jgi:MFS family permease